MLFSLLPMAVFADSAENNKIETLTYINPVYADVIDPLQTAQALDDDEDPEPLREPKDVSELNFTYDELVEEMRENMEDHQSEFTIYYATNKYVDFDTMFEQLLDEAKVVTDVPTQGDYIRWSYSGAHGRYITTTFKGYNVHIFEYTVGFFTTPEQEDELNAEIERVIDEMNIPSDAKEYTKIKTVYDYICAHVKYVMDDTLMQYSAYNAMMTGGAVCQGYATLLYNMMLRLGIGCRVITSIDHAWNIVRIDDLYYNVDSTWDAGYGPSDYDWFLLCQKNFVRHPRENYCKTAAFNAAYPMSQSDYLDAKGHHWINPETVKEANCTESGEIRYTCELCGATGIQTVKALGHNYVRNVCTRCGDVKESGGGINVNPLTSFFNSITSFFSNLFSRLFSIFRF